MPDELEEQQTEVPAMSAGLLVQAAFADAVLGEISHKLGRKTALRILAKWEENLSPKDRESVALLVGNAKRAEYQRCKRAAHSWVRSIGPVLMRRLAE